jgi:hypothetical protein
VREELLTRVVLLILEKNTLDVRAYLRAWTWRGRRAGDGWRCPRRKYGDCPSAIHGHGVARFRGGGRKRNNRRQESGGIVGFAQ